MGKKFLLLFVIIFSLFSLSVSANHSDLHQQFTLDEGYYQGVDIGNPSEYDYSITIHSSSIIDVLILTDAEYDDCCASGETTDYIAYSDSRSRLKVADHRIVTPGGETGYVLLIDNSEVVENGQSPTNTVVVDLYYTEEFDYQFSALGFIGGLIFIPLIVVYGIDLIFMTKYGRKIQILDETLNSISAFLEKMKNEMPESYISRYPALIALIAVNVLWYIVGLLTGISTSGATLDEAVSMGAMWSGGVLQGNLFSLISANFFHFDWQHILFNILGLVFLGSYIEDELGHFGFVSFVMLTGLISSIFSFFNFGVVSGGASGVVFAMLGIISGQLIVGKMKGIENYCRYPDMTYFWSMVILNIAIVPFTGAGGVDLFGHGGGFISGLVVAGFVFKIGRPNTEFFVADSEYISRLVDVEEEDQQTVPNYASLPHDGTYLAIGGKRAYLTPTGHVWYNLQGDEYTLLSWLPPHEEE